MDMKYTRVSESMILDQRRFDKNMVTWLVEPQDGIGIGVMTHGFAASNAGFYTQKMQ